MVTPLPRKLGSNNSASALWQRPFVVIIVHVHINLVFCFFFFVSQ